MPTSPISFIIVTGFLGSGKTTLVNRLLLEGFGDLRVGMVVNDFGALDIDASLITHSKENMLVLANGCICCSLAGDLTRGLLEMMDARPYDRMIMETSGVTSVESLIQALAHKALATRIRLDRVIVVVDATRHVRYRRTLRIADEQVANADVVILNWCDEATPEQHDGAFQSIREVNTLAPIIETTHAQVAIEELGLDLENSTEDNKTFDAHPEKDSWYTARAIFMNPLTQDEFKKAVDQLPESVHRLKGFIQLKNVLTGDIQTIHFQRVANSNSLEVWNRPVPPQAMGILVGIGSIPIADAMANVFDQFEGSRIVSDRSDHHHSHKHNQ